MISAVGFRFVEAVQGLLEARELAMGTAKDGSGPAVLTPEGAGVLRSLVETVAPTTRDVFAGIGHEDLATAHRVLQQVIEQAHKLQAACAN